MMDKELATLLDATSFQVADLVGPAIVIEGAANHLLSRLPETDDHRWNVTQALGSIVAARKSLESAAESLLHIVAQDGADMLAVEIDGGTIVEKAQCPSRAASDMRSDLPRRCRLDAGHVGNHDDQEFRWNDAESLWPRTNAAPGSGRCQEQYRHRPTDPPVLCTRDFGHIGVHTDDEFVWHA